MQSRQKPERAYTENIFMYLWQMYAAVDTNDYFINTPQSETWLMPVLEVHVNFDRFFFGIWTGDLATVGCQAPCYLNQSPMESACCPAYLRSSIPPYIHQLSFPHPHPLFRFFYCQILSIAGYKPPLLPLYFSLFFYRSFYQPPCWNHNPLLFLF